MARKNNNLWINILALLLVAGTIFALCYFYKAAPSHPSESSPNNSESVFSVKDATPISEETEQYSISVTYPETGKPQIDASVKSFIDSQVANYKKTFSEIIPPEGSSYKNTLSINYASQIYDNRLLSYKFAIMYYTGGAHPNTDIQTKVFDIKNQKELTLGDLFIANSDYLKKLSALVINQLDQKNVSDAEWLSAGAGPSLENYKAFGVLDKSIVFYFSPYAVAPYAAGEQQVEITFAQIKDILNSDWFNNLGLQDSNATAGAGLILDSLKENGVIISPLVVTGSVTGQGWTAYEGQVGRVDLLDSFGNLLASSSLSALTNWMELPVKFSATLTFIAPKDSSNGQLVFYNENPSGKPESDKTFALPVLFK